MLAGFASVDITPPIGGVLNGFIARTGRSTGVDVPLSARALWLERDGIRGLIVSMDLLGLAPSFADRLLSRLSENLGVAEQNVILACTHTHSGPMTCPLRGLGPADEEYLSLLESRVIRAARLAVADKSEARAAWGSAPVKIGINRRQIVETDQGPTAVLGRNSAGPADTTVRVLHLESNKRSIILFHHACHPYCLGGDSTLISPDFWGHAAQMLAGQGHESVYLNGCAGDLSPEQAFGGPEAARTTARKLAEAVVEALNRTRPVTDEILEVSDRRFSLEHDRVPELDEIESHLAKADRTVRNVERGDPVVIGRLRTAWQAWFGELKTTLDRPGCFPLLSARISAIRIGDGAIIILPGEVFYEIGHDIASRLSADPVCIAAYGHGYIGYIPVPAAFPLGGYEVDEAHRYVGLWRISPAAASYMVGRVLEMWRDLGGQLQ